MLNVRAWSLGTLSILLCLPSAPQALAAEVAGEVVSVDGIVFVRQDGRQSGSALKPAKPGDQVSEGDVINTASNGKIKLLMKDKSIVDLGPSALFKVDHFAKNGGKDREVDVSMMYGTMRTAVTQKIEGKGRFKVRTPTATMGVRGTEFIVKSEVKNLDEVKHVIANPDKPLPAQASQTAVDATGKGQAGGKPGEKVEEKIANNMNAKTEITVVQGKVDVAKKELPKLDVKTGKVEAPQQVVSLTAGMQISSKTGDTQLARPVVLDTKSLNALSTVAKFQDNTFTKAVVIDMNAGQGGNGPGGRSPASEGGSSSAGEATKAALAVAVAAPPAAPVSADSFHDIPGTFGAGQALNPPSSTKTGALRRLHVTVITQ